MYKLVELEDYNKNTGFCIVNGTVYFSSSDSLVKSINIEYFLQNFNKESAEMKTTSFIPFVFVLRFYIAETGVIIDVTLPALFGALAKGVQMVVGQTQIKPMYRKNRKMV